MRKPSTTQLIASRKAVARRNYEAVHRALQLLCQHTLDPTTITVQKVASISGVSVATIYRRDDLFSLIQQLNPHLARRSRADQYEPEAETTSPSQRRLLKENRQLRQKILDLQSTITTLEALYI